MEMLFLVQLKTEESRDIRAKEMRIRDQPLFICRLIGLLYVTQDGKPKNEVQTVSKSFKSRKTCGVV